MKSDDINQLQEGALAFTLEVLESADKKDPATVVAVAELLSTTYRLIGGF